MRLFNDIYNGKKIFITGHSGFKGLWLTTWLDKMGAIVKGYSIEKNERLPLPVDVISDYNDIRDLDSLKKSIEDFQPDLVMHLAAQPIVAVSYKDPLYTYQVNTMGTVNLFEACKNVNSIKSIVVVITDKCYKNREQLWGYREDDKVGGHDPYSNSKACSALIVESYRDFFYKKKGISVFSAMAGNVLGGGDWAEARIITNIVKSAINNTPFFISDPDAVRPWQYVTDCLSGYLLLGQAGLEGKKELEGSWNFGPLDDTITTVKEVFEKCTRYWDKINKCDIAPVSYHETIRLLLDSSRARFLLKWKVIYEIDDIIEKTISRYKAYYEDRKIITLEQIDEYEQRALAKNLIWTK